MTKKFNLEIVDQYRVEIAIAKNPSEDATKGDFYWIRRYFPEIFLGFSIRNWDIFKETLSENLVEITLEVPSAIDLAIRQEKSQ